MTDALNLIITTAGLQRFTAAQADDDIDLTVSEVGLTLQPFVAAPTLTAVPGEFRRIDTISGAPVGDDIVHLMIRDTEAVTYQVSGFGLYLADGTLFAVYSQQAPIFEKSALATVFMAIDIAFPTADIDQLTFGDTNFLNPPATTETMGVVELATEDEGLAGEDAMRVITAAVLKAVLDALNAAVLAHAVRVEGLLTGGGAIGSDPTIGLDAATPEEADAGEVSTKALVPASLVNILASIADKVPLARNIATSGLLTGGGDLNDDLALGVAKATAALLLAATDDASAVTPAALGGLAHLHSTSGYQTLAGGLILQWGRGTSIVNGISSHTFPLTFPSACFTAVASGGVDGGNEQQDNGPDVIQGSITTGGFQCFSALDSAAPFGWIAVGK